MFQPKFDVSWPGFWRQLYETDERHVWGEAPRSVAFRSWESRAAPIMAAVGKYTPTGSTVLDVASCQGNLAIACADRGYQVTWNDLLADLVGYVKLKDPEGRLRYLPGNAFELAESHAGEWDAVIATEVIEHVAHPDAMLSTLGKLVRPGGFLYMSTPNGQYFRDRRPRFSDFTDTSKFESGQFRPDADGHIFLLHHDEIRALSARAGLDLIDLQVVGNPLTAGHVKLGRVAPLLPEWMVKGVEDWTRRLPYRSRMRVHRHSVFVLRRPL